MVRAVVFILIILGISLYPLLEIKNVKVIKEYKIKNFIPMQIDKGRYFVYEVNLTKMGSFDKLNIFEKKIVAFNFTFFDLLKHEDFFAKKAVYNKPELKVYILKYSNKDYNVSSDFAVYNKLKKTLRGSKFEILSANYRGYGSSFFIDSNKNIFAENINYFLKVK